MKRYILTILCILIISNLSGQTGKNSYLGINALQLPAYTIDLNYSLDIKPFLTTLIDLGYTINYTKSFDFIGFFLTPHTKGGNYGYDLSRQSGGYLKIGSYLNFRKTFETKSYPHIGLFLTNSIIYEKGIYQALVVTEFIPDPIQISHNKFVYGLNLSFGYEFSIAKRLKAYFDFQNSFPNKKYLDLYGYRNYIPGMGYKDSELYWFPMFILNLKYRL
jgi:hypothetical protein